MKLTNDLFIYTWTNVTINNCNTYLINEKHPILIDTGLSMCLKGVLEAIAKDGIDPETIEMIISTHSHPDHFDGITYFMEKKTKKMRIASSMLNTGPAATISMRLATCLCVKDSGRSAGSISASGSSPTILT